MDRLLRLRRAERTGGKVKNVMYRNDPIIFGMPPGISGKSVPLSAANVWLALEKAGVTDVQGFGNIRSVTSR